MPTIQHRRATSVQWTAANPVLAAGEIGFELDTNAIKIGDGLTPWETLLYLTDESLTELLESGRLSEAVLNDTYGQAVEHDWTAPQHFQPGQKNGPLAFTIGDKLGVRMHDGNKGIRFALIGLDQPPGVDEVMPYFEVIAKTRTGTDGGAAVAGYQLHLGPDPGNSINREFFYIEAVGENHGEGPHFRLGVHASGTGVRRPWRLENMGTTAVHFESNSTVRFGHKIVGDQLQSPVEFTRQASNLTAIAGVTYGGGAAQTFLGAANGTEGAGEAPNSGRALGSHLFGSKNGTATVLAGAVRMLTSEAWTFGTAQGTKAEVLITPRGTASNTIALTVDDPSNNQVGAILLVNRGGTTTSSRVTIGAVDSGGTGHRVLRVAN